MPQEIPIVCFLTDKELQKRRRDYLDKTAASLIDFEELENGFSYRFAHREKILRDLAEIIDLERRCCPFLSFKLIIEAGDDFVSLELTGAEGTKEMIESLFDWS
ncbi:MAG TPA: hypothetical protein VGC76_11450 [Pyrinomonadaceae bacterium]|jgi:hypothetical protein